MSEETLRYIPEPERPADFQKRLEALVGLCPIGEPGIRFVWGMDRKKFYGGVEDIVYLDPNGVNVGMPWFIAECWSPESVYDRQEWEDRRYGMATGETKFNFRTWEYEPVIDMTIDVLGPFPERGVWDYLRTCRREDFTPMTFDEMLDTAREWHRNATRPKAAKRAIEDYMRFNDELKAMRLHAFEEAKGKHREFMEKELAKPIDTDFSFAKKHRRPEGVNAPAGMAQTAAGLIVPKSSLDH